MSPDPYESIPLHDDEPAPEDAPPPRDDSFQPPVSAAAPGPGEDAPADVNGDGELPSVDVILLDHHEQLGQLRKDVDDTATVVAKLLENPPKSRPAPWNWKHLDGPAAAKLLTELREWVDWYNDRYGVAADSRIPGCWYRHAPVVEELTAVWIAWKAAYYGHKAPVDAPAYWHERILWPTFERITKRQWGMVNCGAGHKDPRPQSASSTDEGFEDFLTGLSQDNQHDPQQ
jgi:hypothetical protein